MELLHSFSPTTVVGLSNHSITDRATVKHSGVSPKFWGQRGFPHGLDRRFSRGLSFLGAGVRAALAIPAHVLPCTSTGPRAGQERLFVAILLARSLVGIGQGFREASRNRREVADLQQ